jgi:hypothetical protein
MRVARLVISAANNPEVDASFVVRVDKSISGAATRETTAASMEILDA